MLGSRCRDGMSLKRLAGQIDAPSVCVEEIAEPKRWSWKSCSSTRIARIFCKDYFPLTWQSLM